MFGNEYWKGCRKIKWVLCVGLVAFCLPARAQFQDDFSDESVSTSQWWGDWNRFAINKNGWLQSQGSEAGTWYLWHESEASIEASWSFKVRISGTCSAYNNVRFYITMQGDSTSADSYFVQVGGANKNITLYCQQEGVERKVIENADRKKVLGAGSAVVQVRVERDEEGLFSLYSYIEGVDSVTVLEGTYSVDYVACSQVAWCVRHTKQRGYDFYLDDVMVTGRMQEQPVEPQPQPSSASSSMRLSLSSDYIVVTAPGEPSSVCLKADTLLDSWEYTASLYTVEGAKIIDFPSFTDPSTFCWDGTLENTSRASIGIYVLVIEARHKSTKQVERYRFGIAVV